MTSMRIADDLSGGVSTFYAELKKIKAILENAQHNPRLLFLIDVGMSRAVGSSDGAVLRIHNGKHPRATVISPTAAPKQLWP